MSFEQRQEYVAIATSSTSRWYQRITESHLLRVFDDSSVSIDFINPAFGSATRKHVTWCIGREREKETGEKATDKGEEIWNGSQMLAWDRRAATARGG